MDTSLDLGYSTWIIQVSKEHRNFQLHGIKTILESILEENIISHKCLVFLAYVQQEAHCHLVVLIEQTGVTAAVSFSPTNIFHVLYHKSPNYNNNWEEKLTRNVHHYYFFFL